MDWLAFLTALIAVVFVGTLAGLVLWAIVNSRIDLSQLLSEEGGKASKARFQFLLVTLVVGLSFLAITLEKGAFPSVSGPVLWLVGISAGSYLIAKGIQRGAG